MLSVTFTSWLCYVFFCFFLLRSGRFVCHLSLPICFSVCLFVVLFVFCLCCVCLFAGTGTYMLHKPIKEVLYDDNGRVRGVSAVDAETGNVQEARCKKLLADPSYFVGTDKVKKIGQVVRIICVLSHPIPNTSDSESCQVCVCFLLLLSSSFVLCCFFSFSSVGCIRLSIRVSVLLGS